MHGRPCSHAVHGNTAEQSTATTVTTINSYEVPHLNKQNGLKCCVVTCTVNLNNCWHYHKDQCDNCCCVCSTCMVWWPDLVWYFNHGHNTFINTGLPVKQTATIVQQATVHSFLACMHWY